MPEQHEIMMIAGTRIQPGDPVVALDDVENENGTPHALPYTKSIHEASSIDGLAITGGSAGTPVTVVRSGFTSIVGDVPVKVGHEILDGSGIVVSHCDPLHRRGKTLYRITLMVNGPGVLDLDADDVENK